MKMNRKQFSLSYTAGFQKILTLINWRVYQNLRSFTIYLALILSIILGIGYGYIDGHNYLDIQNKYQNNISSVQYGNAIAKVYSQFRPRVFISPDPHSLLISSSIVGVRSAAELMGLFGEPIFSNPYLVDNPFLYYKQSGGFGLSFILLYALFSILLTYRSLSTDKRIGRIKLIFSFEIKRTWYFIAEWCATIITLFIPMILGIFAFIITIKLIGINISAFSLLSLLLIVYGVMTISTFTTIGLWLSAISKSSRAALMLAIIIWAWAVWIWPSLSSETAQAVIQIDSEVDNTRPGLSYTDSVFLYSLPEKPPDGESDYSYGTSIESITKRYSIQSYSASKEKAIYRQYQLSKLLSYFSPISCAQNGLISICGTGGDGSRKFLDYCISQNKEFSKWQHSRFEEHPYLVLLRPGSLQDAGLNLKDIEPVYEFKATDNPVEFHVLSILPNLIWNCVLLFGAIIAFNRSSLVPK